MIDTPYTLIDIFKKHKKYFQIILTEDDFSGGNNGWVRINQRKQQLSISISLLTSKWLYITMICLIIYCVLPYKTVLHTAIYHLKVRYFTKQIMKIQGNGGGDIVGRHAGLC